MQTYHMLRAHSVKRSSKASKRLHYWVRYLILVRHSLSLVSTSVFEIDLTLGRAMLIMLVKYILFPNFIPNIMNSKFHMLRDGHKIWKKSLTLFWHCKVKTKWIFFSNLRCLLKIMKFAILVTMFSNLHFFCDVFVT